MLKNFLKKVKGSSDSGDSSSESSARTNSLPEDESPKTPDANSPWEQAPDEANESTDLSTIEKKDGPITKEDVMDALSNVYDPEVEVDIVTMGLVYDVEFAESGDVRIEMTLTTAACPYGPELVGMTKRAVERLSARNAHVDVVFDPPWKPSEELREMLGV